MDNIISSPSNRIIKHIKSLHKKKYRWEHQNFFVEGVRAVEESIISKGEIEYILYSEAIYNVKGGNELIELIEKEEYTNYQITDKLLKEISDTENPQGIMAVVKLHISNLEDVLVDSNNFLVLLDRLQDPGNMGTIIRTADALGANGVVITRGSVDMFNPKTIRSTMGSIFHIPLVYYDDINDALMELKEKNIKIMSTSLESSVPCYEVDFTKDFALVIGNEASGISKEVLDNSDTLIRIPMVGRAESLNAGVASGIVMYEASRQRKNIQTN